MWLAVVGAEDPDVLFRVRSIRTSLSHFLLLYPSGIWVSGVLLCSCSFCVLPPTGSIFSIAQIKKSIDKKELPGVVLLRPQLFLAALGCLLGQAPRRSIFCNSGIPATYKGQIDCIYDGQQMCNGHSSLTEGWCAQAGYRICAVAIAVAKIRVQLAVVRAEVFDVFFKARSIRTSLSLFFLPHLSRIEACGAQLSSCSFYIFSPIVSNGPSRINREGLLGVILLRLKSCLAAAGFLLNGATQQTVFYSAEIPGTHIEQIE